MFLYSRYYPSSGLSGCCPDKRDVMRAPFWVTDRLSSRVIVPATTQPIGVNSPLWRIAPQHRHFATDPAAFAMLRKRGVPEPTVTALEKGLPGALFDDQESMMASIKKALGQNWRATLRSDPNSRDIAEAYLRLPGGMQPNRWGHRADNAR